MADLQDYKCPACGGALLFDSGLQKMKCPFCESVFAVEEVKTRDAELENEAANPQVNVQTGGWSQEEQSGLWVYSCQSCGGEIVGDETMAATSCPYCNNPVVVRGQFTGALRPDYIIPFKLDKNRAVEALKRFYKGRVFLPKSFKDQNKINEIKGIYVPFWLYSGTAQGDINYEMKNIRTWQDSTYNYTETKFYRAIRKGSLQFGYVPVDASRKMEDDLMDSIEPYNMGEAVHFQTAYMAGYLADKYDLDANSCVGRANVRVKSSTESAFARTVTGYNSVSRLSSIVQFTDVSVNYILLPVWMLVTKWQGKEYTFAMNGQTGNLMGKLPIDKKKKWGWFAGIAAAIALLLFPIVYAILG